MAITTGNFPKALVGGKGKAKSKAAPQPKGGVPLFALFGKKGRSGGRGKK